MKGVVIIPIVIGAALLIAGGAVFGVALAHNSKNSQTEEKTYEVNETFEKFNIELNTANLEFKASEDGKTKVVCDEKEKEHYSVAVSDNTLNIKIVDERQWYEKIFNFDFKTMKVTVFAPAGNYTNLDIKSATGNIVIPHNYSFTNVNAKLSTGNVDIKSDVGETLDIEASTGKVSLSNLSATNLKIKVSTGDIYLEKLNIAERITTKASTGNLKLDDVKCQNIDVKSSTGNVNFIKTIVSNHVDIDTDTGDVKFVDSDADTLKIKTDTGNITGNFLTSKIFYVKNKTGVPVYPVSTEGGLCEIETDTGRINIRIG